MVTRGFSPTHFVLPMSRQDIASYLHLSPETLSRILRQFENRGLISASRREIRLKDLQALEKCCPHEFHFRDKVPIT
jgi:CRP/FNR family transcriptional regulator